LFLKTEEFDLKAWKNYVFKNGIFSCVSYGKTTFLKMEELASGAEEKSSFEKRQSAARKSPY